MNSADVSIQHLIKLDQAGFFARNGESPDEYLARAEKEAFSRPTPDVSGDPDFAGAVPMRKNILQEGAGRTDKLFAFSSTAVSGYFLKRGFGLFWGGCTVSDEQGRVCFALRDDFQERKKWFIYDRAELLAHEQCHAARACLPDGPYEEIFAYMTSEKPLRRYLGGCFRSRLETGIFALLAFLLIAAEIAVVSGWMPDRFLTPFLIALLAGMVGALIRNQSLRNRLFLAEKKLKTAGIRNSMALLFRASTDEINTIAASKQTELSGLLETWERTELRWRAALARFR